MEIRDDVPRKLIGGTSPHDLQYPLTTLQPIAMSFPDAIRREKGHEAAIVAAVETIGKGVTKFGTSPFNLHASEVIHKASRYKRDAMSCTRKFTLMARSGPSITFPIRNYGYYIISKTKEIYWARSEESR